MVIFWVYFEGKVKILSLFYLTYQQSVGLSTPSSLKYCLHLSSRIPHSLGCTPLTQVIPSQSPLSMPLTFKQRIPNVGSLVLFCIYTYLHLAIASVMNSNTTYWVTIPTIIPSTLTFSLTPRFLFLAAYLVLHMCISKKYFIFFKIKLLSVNLKCATLALFPV